MGQAVDNLCQAALRRAGAGARVSWPLHAPGGDHQQPDHRYRQRHGAVQLPGPQRRQYTKRADDRR